MTPIPSDPLKRPPNELTLGDGRKFKLKLPGLEPDAEPSEPTEPSAAEPPGEDAPSDPDAA